MALVYFKVMPVTSTPLLALPTTLGFSPVDDRTRLPGRFFYRLLVGRKLAA